MGARGDRPSGDRIVAVIEGQGWLDKPSYKIEHGMALVSNLLGPAGVRVRDFLHGRCTPLDSEPFPDEWRTLVHTLEGHATEEETGMFPEAGAYLGTDELQALGQALQARQAQLRRSRLVQARHWLKRETLRRL
ncbi:MAG TPA: hypothetical protein VFW50_03190 [Streptosporangiaceae bacterium]|nr:hypothetical protein [Streptosporangiaceae bacterium]